MQLLNEKLHFLEDWLALPIVKKLRKNSLNVYKNGVSKRKNIFLGTVHSFCISQIIIPFAKLFNDDFALSLDIITDAEKQKYSI